MHYCLHEKSGAERTKVVKTFTAALYLTQCDYSHLVIVIILGCTYVIRSKLFPATAHS